MFLKDWKKLKVGEDRETLKPCYTAGENVNGTATLENGLAVKHTCMYIYLQCPKNFTLGYLTKRNENTYPHKTCTQTVVSPSSIIAPNCK